MILWFSGIANKIDWLAQSGAIMTASVLVLLLGLMISLPLSGILNLINKGIEKWRKPENPATGGNGSRIDEHRRIFLKGTAAALPFISLSLGTGGIASSFTETNVYLRKFIFPNLPPALERFRILHITDSHLGIYKYVYHIEEILQSAREYKPDIILMTGDIADELELLPETLQLIAKFGAPHGVYGIPGNHEYYRGIDKFKEIHKNSPVPLLIDAGETINVNGVSLYIAGADDPRSMHGNYVETLNKSIDKSINNAPAESFKILLSHRPEALDRAAELGINLTLSGHTHGGQIGIGDRSFFEKFMPDRYLWGEYNIGKAHMYVSSGIGHWFPFRLGCQPEAPIIELAST